MSKINDYYQKKQLIEQLTEELEHLKNDSDLKAELEFEDKIRKLMSEYEKTAQDALKILATIDPSINKGQSASASVRPKRPLKTYKNPHSGEVVKTRGGNHKTLKEWRQKYGKETVQSWAE
jgi:hypothetical protein